MELSHWAWKMSGAIIFYSVFETDMILLYVELSRSVTSTLSE